MCRVNHDTCGGVSILISIRASEKSAQRMTLILGVNIPRGMPKRSISSPSPNSLSIKKYYAPNIRNTKWRHYDGGHKNGISQPKLSYFFILFVAHVIRIAFVYSFKGDVLFFVFFLYFLAKMSAGFSCKRPYTPTFEKKKAWPPLNRLVL